MSDIEERLYTLKQEVDALQISMAAQTRPWYTNVSTIVAVTALLFSFGTTALSYQRSVAQDIANSREELRGILQRIVELPRQNIEVMTAYSADPAARQGMLSSITEENSFLIAQARSILDSLPVDQVSPAEYYSVAQALFNSYQILPARQYFELAQASAVRALDFNVEVAALRALGNLAFLTQEIERGREHYRAAKDIFGRHPQFDSYTKAVTHVKTDIVWAYSEASAGFVMNAADRIEAAERVLADWPEMPGIVDQRKTVEDAKRKLLLPE